ncbi:hypothetical protein DIPPA_09658 [Diplonema papillatum]|nr:hypothetical protein DIPPA_09658 [Diplonema papillatum]
MGVPTRSDEELASEVYSGLSQREKEELLEMLDARLKHTAWESALEENVRILVDATLEAGEPLQADKLVAAAAPVAQSSVPESAKQWMCSALRDRLR